jgi:hypothetical protein
MELESIQVLIGTMGFPIVAYLLMFFKLLPVVEGLTKAVNSLEKVISKGE